MGGFSLSYFLLLEYQAERQNRPNIIGLFGAEVALNHRQHFGTVGEKLDRIRSVRRF
jgi:hypothetical protein